jgi:type IV pilus assembly protein PilN
MATRINLLDWRAARRARRKKEFLSLLVLGLGASAALIGLGYVTVEHSIETQQARNQFMTAQIAEMDKQIKEIQELEKVRANLVARMHVIEQLQQSRAASVTIDGIAESSGRISAYLKNLDGSPWFKDPKLVVIKTAEKNKQRNSEFTLQVTNLTRAVADDAPQAAKGEVVQ